MRLALGLLALLAGFSWGWAAAQSSAALPEVGARAYLLLDLSTEQQLAARDADVSRAPASLTKLMTAYLVFDALRVRRLSLDARLLVSEQAQRQPGTRMFLQTGMRVPVADLIKGLLVQSGNDAAMVLAEGVAGTAERFVQLMNEQALALGMKSTHFVNPSGLPAPAQRSTARDLALLSARLLQDFPDYAPFFAIRKYRYAGTPVANEGNRNLLLFRDPSVDGLKTGHTDEAGFSLVASARRTFPHLGPQGNPGLRRLLVVVLGSDSENARATDAQKLLNWGYTAFETVKLFDGEQAVLTPAIWKGSQAQVRLGWPQPLLVSVPHGQAKRLRTEVLRPDPLTAPMRKGQTVGLLRIYNAEQLVLEKPLLSLDSVDESGLLGRAWDALRLWLQ